MKSKSKAIIVISAIVLVAAGGVGGYFYYRHTVDSRPKEYDTVAVSRNTVERVIVSTGTLDPVGSVEVGTQVSGTVDKVLVDFNDTVKAGQVIAEIDRSVLISKLSEAQASLSRAEAQFMQSEEEFKRSEVLHGKGLISEQDFTRARTDYLSQKASHQVARAALNTAAENVRYATIRSPVRGTVIKRAVDVGQTVAASLSAPTLFIIAEDLKKMKIMAQVDETDIGKIKTGQEVRFSVQAYPDKKYAGQVSQVRLQPEVVQNVVTYTVVILADNDDGTLLPGMTANVEFVEAREENALTVPAAALRFQPPDDVVKRFAEERERAKGLGGGGDGADGGDGLMVRGGDGGGVAMKRPPEGGRDRQGGDRQGGDRKGGDRQGGERRKSGEGKAGEGRGGGGGGGKRPSGGIGSRGVLWVLDDDKEWKPVFVRIGLSDGVITVVTGRDDLVEGMRVVSGEAKPVKDKKDAGKGQQKSLIPQQGGGGRRM